MTKPGHRCARGEVSLFAPCRGAEVVGGRCGEAGGSVHLLEQPLLLPTSAAHFCEGRAAGWRARMFWVWIRPAFDVTIIKIYKIINSSELITVKNFQTGMTYISVELDCPMAS